MPLLAVIAYSSYVVKVYYLILVWPVGFLVPVQVKKVMGKSGAYVIVVGVDLVE